MWRTRQQRAESAAARILLAQQWWGWQPHSTQQGLFSSDASVRVAACGRRWGKTECLSIDIATLALAERGAHQLIVAPTAVQARLLGDAVRERLDQAFAHGDPELEGRSLAARSHPYLLLTIRDENSGADEAQIACRTAGRDGRNLRGLWAHRIIVDEAAYVPDRVLCEVLPPMLADKGGEFLLASSPNGRRDAFYRLYARGLVAPPPADAEMISYAAFQCASTDNPHLDRAWLRAQHDDMGELLYAQEFEAKFIDDFGMVFREEDIDAAIAEIPGVVLRDHTVDSVPERGHWYVAGIDWGRKYDYTVVVILDTDSSPVRLVHLSRRRGASWRAQAEEVAQLLVRFGVRQILVDNNSMGDSVAEMVAHQIQEMTKNATWYPKVDRYDFSSETKQTLIDKLNVGLSAHALQFPPHPALMEELRNFEYAPGGPGRLKMAARAGGHDDCVIALALAFFKAPRPTTPLKNFGILLGSQYGVGRREEY